MHFGQILIRRTWVWVIIFNYIYKIPTMEQKMARIL